MGRRPSILAAAHAGSWPKGRVVMAALGTEHGGDLSASRGGLTFQKKRHRQHNPRPVPVQTVMVENLPVRPARPPVERPRPWLPAQPLPSSTGVWHSTPLARSTPRGWRSSRTCCHQSLKGTGKVRLLLWAFVHLNLLLWGEFCPPSPPSENLNVEALTPTSTLECDCVWRQGLSEAVLLGPDPI